MDRSARPSSSWQSITEDVALQRLESQKDGLDQQAVAARQKQYGPNLLPPPKGTSAVKILLRQFRSFVLLLLMAAAIFSFITRESTEAVAIIAIIILNGLIGFYQEYRAERAVTALRDLTKPVSRVRRSGNVFALETSELVPGDIVLVEAGDHVPADCRILKAHDLQANEAPLTGESMPVSKSATPVSIDAPLAECTSMLFLGTSITRGSAESLVVETGKTTQLGIIASLINTAAPEERSPLQRNVDALSQKLGWISLGLVAAVFVTALLRSEPSLSLLVFAVSVAVAAVPEGLPAIVTIALSLGVRGMARRRAIVRKLEAIETLGTTTVICTDKTGTLTTGEMVVREVETHDPKQLALVFAGCETAHLAADGSASSVGDPTELALLRYARTESVERSEIERSFPELHLLPFDSDRKMMSVLRRGPESASLLLSKGAPDVLLSKCSHYLSAKGKIRLTSEMRQQIASAIERLSSQGMRVIAAASRTFQTISPSTDTLETELTFVGLAALADPPRGESREMVRSCLDAGIKVIMITGDHPSTAFTIAKEIGIVEDESQVVSGATLDSTEDWAETIAHARVFARTTASHKLDIVKALRARSEIVAMTGDGVNDAPALQGAHIGMAMGKSGTDVAKASSQIIIMDDNFATIAQAIEYGRSAFSNIRKAVEYLLTGNAAELIVLGLCFLFSLPGPLTALQLLWINLITDGLPALVLAAEGVQANVMKSPPRGGKDGLLDRANIRRIMLLGGVSAVVWFVYYSLSLTAVTAGQAKTALFMLLIVSEMLRSLSYRRRDAFIWQYDLRKTLPLLGVIFLSVLAQLAITLIPSARTIFGLDELQPGQFLTVLLVALIPLAIAEAAKIGRKRRASIMS